MVYFASVDEMRYVQRGLLVEARQHPVLDELRGWGWPGPPLRPVYARALAVDDVLGGICPTGRDLYLAEEYGEPRLLSRAAGEGAILKAAIASVLLEGKALIARHGVDAVDHLERLAEHAFSQLGSEPAAADPDERCREHLWRMRAFEARRVLERLADTVLAVGRTGADALAALAVPVHIDVPLSGRWLGLTNRVIADAISFRDGVVFSVQFGPTDERHRLVTAGLALVAESAFERPFDLGCVVYPEVVENRVEVRRDYHVIGDELRQIFIEERDDRMQMLDAGADPGLPAECPVHCPYLQICRPPLTVMPVPAQSPIPATRPAVGQD